MVGGGVLLDGIALAFKERKVGVLSNSVGFRIMVCRVHE